MRQRPRTIRPPGPRYNPAVTAEFPSCEGWKFVFREGVEIEGEIYDGVPCRKYMPSGTIVCPANVAQMEIWRDKIERGKQKVRIRKRVSAACSVGGGTRPKGVTPFTQYCKTNPWALEAKALFFTGLSCDKVAAQMPHIRAARIKNICAKYGWVADRKIAMAPAAAIADAGVVAGAKVAQHNRKLGQAEGRAEQAERTIETDVDKLLLQAYEKVKGMLERAETPLAVKQALQALDEVEARMKKQVSAPVDKLRREPGNPQADDYRARLTVYEKQAE